MPFSLAEFDNNARNDDAAKKAATIERKFSNKSSSKSTSTASVASSGSDNDRAAAKLDAPVPSFAPPAASNPVIASVSRGPDDGFPLRFDLFPGDEVGLSFTRDAVTDLMALVVCTNLCGLPFKDVADRFYQVLSCCLAVWLSGCLVVWLSGCLTESDGCHHIIRNSCFVPLLLFMIVWLSGKLAASTAPT